MWKAAVRICRGSVPSGACVAPTVPSGSHTVAVVRGGTAATAPVLLLSRLPFLSARPAASAATSQQQQQQKQQQQKRSRAGADNQQTPAAASPQSSTDKRSLDDQVPRARPDVRSASASVKAPSDVGAQAPASSVIGATKTGSAFPDAASLAGLLAALHDQTGTSAARSAAGSRAGTRLSLAMQAAASAVDLVEGPQQQAGAPTIDGAGVAVCNALLLLLLTATGEQAAVRPASAALEAAVTAALDRQPLSVLLAAARHLELDELCDSPADKVPARQRLMHALKAKLAATGEPVHAVLALQTCNTFEASGFGGDNGVQGRKETASKPERRSALDYSELRDAAERAVLRLATRMDGVTVCRVLHLLAMAPVGSSGSVPRSHTVQLMRALAHQAGSRQFVLTGQQLANALYACATLGLYDRRLLMRLDEAAAFATKRNRLAPDALASVVLSMGKLRWSSPALLDSLFVRCCDTSSPSSGRLAPSLKSGAVVSLLHTCAQLAFAPSGLTLVADEALTRAAAGGPDLLLDGTWSLLVVGAHSRSHLAAVLNTEFLKNLSGLHLARYKKAYNDLKLLNIAFEAAGGSRQEFERLQRDVLGSHVDISKVKAVSREKSAASVVDDVAAVLSYVAPKDTHQRQRVMTASGHDVDVELLVDSSGQPKPLGDYARPGGSDRHGMRVPADWQWVAIKVLGYYDVLLSAEPLPGADSESTDVLSSTCKPVGRHVLATRQLAQMGYAVVTVDYKEYSSSMEAAKKLEILQRKILASLQ